MRIKQTKELLYDLQNGRCFYCDVKMAFHESTFDHIVPKSRKSAKDIFNGVAACKDCNNEKGAQPFIVFYAYKKGLANV